VLATAALLTCGFLGISTAQPGESAPHDDSSGGRFARWLDAEAARAIAAGAEARKKATTADAVRARAERVRQDVLEAMGGLPGSRTPLNARITGRLERDGYRIEHLVFESQPDFFVTANVYVPEEGPGPYPAVLGTAGHSDVGKAADLYQHVWVNLARRGIIALAFDPPGQGERLEYFDPAAGKSTVGAGTREHDHVGKQALLTGTSIARYFSWDGIRALDYLLTRSDVDPKRIGAAGNSGGGTQAAWLGIVEPRLSAIDSSCYITSWSALWHGPGPQDMEQTLPGFLSRGLDFPDMLIAAAPRPYLVSSAARDFFPIEGARATVAEARAAYAALGAADRLDHVENDAQHGWSQPLREAAYRWFGRWWLDGSAASRAAEPPFTPEAAEALRATPTGQVSTSYAQSRTMFDLNADRARRLASSRGRVTKNRLRELLQVSGAVANSNTVDAGLQVTIARRAAAPPIDGLRTEQLELTLAGDLALPARLVHPRARARGSAVVAATTDPAGSGGDEAARPAAEWARLGYLTLLLDVRGTGALAPEKGQSGYSGDYQLAARAWLLGTSVVAWQTRDLVAGLSLLERELPDAKAERVLAVDGLTAPAGVFAAALHPIRELWVTGGIVSYLDVATTRAYAAPARLFVPGVLEVTDLPEAMALAAPAAIHLVRPIRADGSAISSAEDLGRVMGAGVPANVRLEAGAASASGAR
jgi:cephalosporin-C deacetylase-like acetyl esterase